MDYLGLIETPFIQPLDSLLTKKIGNLLFGIPNAGNLLIAKANIELT